MAPIAFAYGRKPRCVPPFRIRQGWPGAARGAAGLMVYREGAAGPAGCPKSPWFRLVGRVLAARPGGVLGVRRVADAVRTAATSATARLRIVLRPDRTGSTPVLSRPLAGAGDSLKDTSLSAVSRETTPHRGDMNACTPTTIGSPPPSAPPVPLERAADIVIGVRRGSCGWVFIYCRRRASAHPGVSGGSAPHSRDRQ